VMTDHESMCIHVSLCNAVMSVALWLCTSQVNARSKLSPAPLQKACLHQRIWAEPLLSILVPKDLRKLTAFSVCCSIVCSLAATPVGHLLLMTHLSLQRPRHHQ